MAMSKLLSLISSQVALSFAGPPESSESQAFYHIATLLTRGSHDNGHARDVIAVTGVQQQADAASTSKRLDLDKPTQAITPSSPDIDSNLVEIHLFIAQNQSVESPSNHHVFSPVQPSSLPVSAILHTVYVMLSVRNMLPPLLKSLLSRSNKGSTPVSLEQHAGDIFKALTSTSKLHRTTDGTKYIDASYLALSVIIGRSFPKISRRVQAVRFLFKSKFLERLLKEKLNQSSELVVTPTKQVPVYLADKHQYIEVGAKLEELFVSSGVPFKIHDGVHYFLFHISSAMKWMKTLVSVHTSIKASTQKRPTKNAEWHSLYTQLEQLHRMVYFLERYYNAILSLTDVVDFLQENLQKRYVVNDLRKHLLRKILSD